MGEARPESVDKMKTGSPARATEIRDNGRHSGRLHVTVSITVTLHPLVTCVGAHLYDGLFAPGCTGRPISVCNKQAVHLPSDPIPLDDEGQAVTKNDFILVHNVLSHPDQNLRNFFSSTGSNDYLPLTRNSWR